jgi:hypothetical protein
MNYKKVIAKQDELLNLLRKAIGYNYGFSVLPPSASLEALKLESELAELKSQPEQPMYSREFVEWFFNKYKYYVKFQVNEEPVRYGYNNDSNLPEGTLDELLAYYETNVKENK